MTDFTTIVAAVVVGYLIATGIMMCVMMNEFVLKKFIKWSYKMSTKFMFMFEELEDDDFMKEKEKIEA